MAKKSKEQEEIEQLREIIEAYEKLTSYSRDELLDATRTIQAHEKIADLSREELLALRKELDELKDDQESQQEKIKHILLEDASNETFILKELEELKKSSNDNFYVDLFKVLLHYDFSGELALKSWKEIQENNHNMSEALGRPIGFRVAMLDYFINKNKILHSPKIIEISLFDEVIRSSLQDELTSLYNRRYFNQVFAKEIDRAKRHKRKLSLFIFDIDDFKKVNDELGHSAGDDVLRKLSILLRATIRNEDIACRYGGEEFLVILPETEGPGAEAVAERFRVEVSKQRPYDKSISISGGIAHFPTHGEDATSLFVNADRALFRAKNEGKNRINVAIK